ncbi:MAG: DEAD/DEAH box helicase, partial [Proteobacteria bacterium]|nr:DEAD/DEAH box helicase [Pseudomonadota bacterium]
MGSIGWNDLRCHFRPTPKNVISASSSGCLGHRATLWKRLRQAACHPALIDKKSIKESSAKLDILLEQLEEIVSTGHKALVFSQFTGLLDIVRHSLEKAGIAFEYLDGKTRDRAGPVDRFQNDPDGKIPVFLISLKAGGVGLNLTAADYCFILDPRWNPTAEAQAISRAHRIG